MSWCVRKPGEGRTVPWEDGAMRFGFFGALLVEFCECGLWAVGRFNGELSHLLVILMRGGWSTVFLESTFEFGKCCGLCCNGTGGWWISDRYTNWQMLPPNWKFNKSPKLFPHVEMHCVFSPFPASLQGKMNLLSFRNSTRSLTKCSLCPIRCWCVNSAPQLCSCSSAGCQSMSWAPVQCSRLQDKHPMEQAAELQQRGCSSERFITKHPSGSWCLVPRFL